MSNLFIKKSIVLTKYHIYTSELGGGGGGIGGVREERRNRREGGMIQSRDGGDGRERRENIRSHSAMWRPHL